MDLVPHRIAPTAVIGPDLDEAQSVGAGKGLQKYKIELGVWLRLEVADGDIGASRHDEAAAAKELLEKPGYRHGAQATMRWKSFGR
jgi:hypothetical protein